MIHIFKIKNFAAVTLACALVASGGPAVASSPGPDSLDTQSAKLFSDAKVDSDTGLRLAQKVERGERLQSETSGAKPISTDSWFDGNMKYTKSTFKDDSFRVVGIESPDHLTGKDRPDKQRHNADAQGTSMKGCTSTSGSGYVSRKNCRIRALGISYDASFRADFTHTNSKIGTIGAVRSPRVSVIGGTHSKMKLKINRKKSTARLPAEASLSWYFKSKGDAASGNVYIYLHVKAKSTEIISD